MTSSASTLFAIAALAAAGAVATAGPISAQDARAGQLLYETYCAACHGDSGRGEGRMAPILSVLPSDLTVLSEYNDGAFPAFDVARQIDGRDPILAHGGDMPIFGDFFDTVPMVDIAEPSGQRMMVSVPVADLIAFLEEIQS